MQSDIDANVDGFFTFKTTGDLVSTLVGAAIIVAALASLLYLIVGAVGWTTAGSDKTKVEGAQKTMTNAIIGLVITVSAYAIWTLAKSFLGLDTVLTE